MAIKSNVGRVLLVILVALLPAVAEAQTDPDQRATSLPSPIKWTVNFDAGWGTFGFANSLYDNTHEGVPENLSDQWFEGYVKPALSGSYTLSSSSELYGKVSVVGERTYGSIPDLYGSDVSSFGPEDLSIGWRSGTSIGSHENLLDFSVGRSQYTLGHGMLLFDGAAEGGSRGGYWTNARKAFEFAAIARVKAGPHTGEVFYLDKDELNEFDTGTRLWGANYELALGEHSTLGATYMKFMAHEDLEPGRDGLAVFNWRTYASPSIAPDASFEFEYAAERNGDVLDSNAWTIQGGYQLSKIRFTPKITYRYAFFQGDDPETEANEAFDPLLPGFHDWGTWWQGEIAGEYFLSNSNLVSHQARGQLDFNDSVGSGVIFYKFRVDQPATFGPGVTSKDIGTETDVYVDWSLTTNFSLSLLGAVASPGPAAEQATGRTNNFRYGMVYVGYSF
jgi:alginate export protein